MGPSYWVLFFASVLVAGGLRATGAGAADPIYKSCVKQCKTSGCVEDQCFPTCNLTSNANAAQNPWFIQEPMYLRWKEWVCLSDCRYHCMLSREEERRKLGDQPIKYHGKWPVKRVMGIQEPVSVALSGLNLALHFHGWLSYLILLNHKLPLRPNGQTYYRFSGLWHLYGILAMNFWFWSAAFHGRYVEITERLYYSSEIISIGCGLISSILRAFNILAEAPRVMVAAPLIAFLTTHVLFLNLVDLDYAWNMAVLVAVVAGRILFGALWAARSKQASCWKLWVFVVGGAVAIALEVYDFPAYKGLVDAHALWEAISIPLTYLWWSLIRDDAEFTTTTLIKKAK